MAFKLATRQAIVQTAQEEQVESIVSVTSVIAGVYLRSSVPVSATVYVVKHFDRLHKIQQIDAENGALIARRPPGHLSQSFLCKVCHMHGLGTWKCMHAGLRLVQAAFPTGAMWPAAEAHAAWMVRCLDVKLYAPSAHGTTDGDDGASVAVRRCKESEWHELPAKVRLAHWCFWIHLWRRSRTMPTQFFDGVVQREQGPRASQPQGGSNNMHSITQRAGATSGPNNQHRDYWCCGNAIPGTSWQFLSTQTTLKLLGAHDMSS